MVKTLVALLFTTAVFGQSVIINNPGKKGTYAIRDRKSVV